MESLKSPEKQLPVRKRKVQVWIYRLTSEGLPEVLLLKLRPERGGFWQPVTGGVEADESFEQAALREAQEETGLSFSDPIAHSGYQFEFEGRGARAGTVFEEHVFFLRASASPGSDRVRLDPHEHVESQWLEPEQASRRLSFSSNSEGLSRLMRTLSEGRR